MPAMFTASISLEKMRMAQKQNCTFNLAINGEFTSPIDGVVIFTMEINMRNDKIHNAIQALHEVLKEELGDYAVSADIFINASEYQFTYKTRTPDSLDMDGISMRNLSGEFIK